MPLGISWLWELRIEFWKMEHEALFPLKTLEKFLAVCTRSTKRLESPSSAARM